MVECWNWVSLFSMENKTANLATKKIRLLFGNRKAHKRYLRVYIIIFSLTMTYFRRINLIFITTKLILLKWICCLCIIFSVLSQTYSLLCHDKDTQNETRLGCYLAIALSSIN